MAGRSQTDWYLSRLTGADRGAARAGDGTKGDPSGWAPCDQDEVTLHWEQLQPQGRLGTLPRQAVLSQDATQDTACPSSLGGASDSHQDTEREEAGSGACPESVAGTQGLHAVTGQPGPGAGLSLVAPLSDGGECAAFPLARKHPTEDVVSASWGLSEVGSRATWRPPWN